MHASVLHFVSAQVTAKELADKSVLEVGSLNVNGSVRKFFTGPYLGIDMREGRGVDAVLNAHFLDQDVLGKFEVIVCTEMLEHDSAPWLTSQAMRTVASPGATLLVTARGYDRRGCFPIHAYPDDLWRFSVKGMENLLRYGGWTVEKAGMDPDSPGVFAVATA